MKKLFVGLPVLFFPTATDPTFHEGNRQPHAATVANVLEKTADDKFVPWLASQTDMLAEDWLIIE